VTSECGQGLSTDSQFKDQESRILSIVLYNPCKNSLAVKRNTAK